MTEYTATFMRALIEEIEPTKVEVSDAETLAAAVETLEGMECLLTRLPAAERHDALSNIALNKDGVLWFPTARNCRLSVGVAVEADGFVSFAVGDESSIGEALVTHFSARAAVAHALRGARDRRTPETGTDEDAFASGDTSAAGHDGSLVEAIRASGWAIPVTRRLEHLAPELLARVARLSEDGVAHLFASEAGGGVVLAMAGSTVDDRRRAANSLPLKPAVGTEVPARRRQKQRPAPRAVRAGSRPAPRPAAPTSWPLMSPADLAGLWACLGKVRQADPGTPKKRLATAVALLKARILEALEAAGGAEAEKRLLGPLTGRGSRSYSAAARLALAALARDGEVERLLHMSGALLVVRPGASDEALAHPLRRDFGALADSALDERHFSEEDGWGLTENTGKAVPGRELEAAAERFRAARAGSLAVAETKAERRRIEANRKRLRARFVARRRRGEELVVRPAREIDAARKGEREAHWTEDGELKRRTERARRSGQAAYDTARAVYLGQLPTFAHRLLHLLRREGGAVHEREFVSRHAKLASAGTPALEAALKAALRELADAGKVRRLRSRGTGEVFLTAIEPLDEGSFRRSLNSLIRESALGIVSPWTEVAGVEPEGEENEEALLERDPEDCFPEETGREAFLDTVADESAEQEIEALTA
ncbi:hypothetical protein BH24ACT19_BH24ACT19_08050 [soil metagenome]